MTTSQVGSAIFLALAISSFVPAEPTPVFHGAQCEGVYPHHLQGICTDEKDAIYWSFTTVLVKTDQNGKLLKKTHVANHHGDLCHQDGKIYVAVNLGYFNDPDGKSDSWVYVYDADDLSELGKHKTPEVFHGAGGIAHHNGRFIVVGGLPPGIDENYAYEYDRYFHFIKRHMIKSGYTLKGIQTATFADGCWWFGCYGSPKILLRTDESFQTTQRFIFNCSLGIVGVGSKSFLVAKGACRKGTGCIGEVEPAEQSLLDLPSPSRARRDD